MGLATACSSRWPGVWSRASGPRIRSAVRGAMNSSCCCRKYAQHIIAALVAPHDVAQHQLHVTVTIGISIFPADGPNAETLIKCADTAMYHAKERSRNSYQFFERAMN